MTRILVDSRGSDNNPIRAYPLHPRHPRSYFPLQHPFGRKALLDDEKITFFCQFDRSMALRLRTPYRVANDCDAYSASAWGCGTLQDMKMDAHEDRVRRVD